MSGVIDEIGKNFERLLRWAYPGGLFLVLLFFSTLINGKSTAFNTLLAYTQNNWLVIFFAGIFIGSAIYIFQSNVVANILKFLLKLIPSKCCLHLKRRTKISELLTRAALNPQWFQGYIDYAWA